MRSTEPWILSRTTWATVTGRQVFAPGTGERPSVPLTATAIAGVHCRSGCSRTMILMRGSLDTRTPLPTRGRLTTTPNKRPEVSVSTFEAFQAEMGRFNLGALSCRRSGMLWAGSQVILTLAILRVGLGLISLGW